jgi:hypothetical protein
MSLRDTFVTALFALVLTLVSFSILSQAKLTVAQVMQSTNYRIQSDSVNLGGGLSTSTNYTLESTMGESGTGELSGTTYNLKAGYQQMVTTFLSMTAPSNVSMTPSIPGVSGGIANGSTTVTVTTDSPAGYQLSVEAENSPAMQKGVDTIADYAPAGGNPDYTFTTDATDSHFGYSPSGVDVVTRFKDNGATCNDNTQETAFACWDGLSTTAENISSATSGNTPDGATTTVYFRVGIGGSVTQEGGSYAATTTLTAISL